MKKDLTLVILAAGMGSRFGGLKQIEPMGPNGEFIIDYSVYDAIKAGFTKIVFIIKEENYQIFKETIGKRVEPHIKVEYAFQNNETLPQGFKYPKDRTKPYGTGHALLCAKEKVKEDFAIISADDFFGYDAFKKAADFLNESNDFCVIGYNIGETLSDKGEVKRGVCMEENGYLTAVIESRVIKKDAKVYCEPLNENKPFTIDENHPVSMLMFGLRPIIFEELEKEIVKFFEKNKENMETCEFLLPDVLDKIIKNKKIKIKVIKTTSKWLGVTYKEDTEHVKNEIKKLTKISKTYPNHLWE
ncbi:MAG: nucleotidyltransferase [Bacilli bacterium]|nr:nucleotidyltransferase [Bacilli bacterium]